MATAVPQSTQEANPGKAVNRTLLVTIISAFPVLNLALVIMLEELEPYVGILPGWVFGALNLALVITTLLVGVFTRIMAIPAVSDWFRRHAPVLAPDANAPTVPGTSPGPAPQTGELPSEQG